FLFCGRLLRQDAPEILVDLSAKCLVRNGFSDRWEIAAQVFFIDPCVVFRQNVFWCEQHVIVNEPGKFEYCTLPDANHVVELRSWHVDPPKLCRGDMRLGEPLGVSKQISFDEIRREVADVVPTNALANQNEFFQV